jgi:hypothetical protein
MPGLHHITTEVTAAQIATIIATSTAVEDMWYYDTDNDLLYKTRESDNKLIGPLNPPGQAQIQLYTRTVDTTANRTVEICNITANQGVMNIQVTLEINESAFKHTATFLINRPAVTAAATWFKALPLSSTGIDGTNNIDLEVQNQGNDLKLRLRRTGGSTSASVKIRIENQSTTSVVFGSITGTSTDATALNPYTYTRISQVGDKLAFHKQNVSNSAIATEFGGAVYMPDHLSIGAWGGSSPLTLSPWLHLPLSTSNRRTIEITDASKVYWRNDHRDTSFNDYRYVDSGAFVQTFQRGSTTPSADPIVGYVARQNTFGTPQPVGNDEIPFAWGNNGTSSPILAMYGDKRVQLTRYINTQNDTSSKAPDNFFYTGTTGMVYSAPIGYSWGNILGINCGNTTPVACGRNRIHNVTVANSVAGVVNLPASDLTLGDKVVVKFINVNTSNTLTVSGNSNNIDVTETSVTVAKNESVVFCWFGSGTNLYWHRIAGYKP